MVVRIRDNEYNVDYTVAGCLLMSLNDRPPFFEISGTENEFKSLLHLTMSAYVMSMSKCVSVDFMTLNYNIENGINYEPLLSLATKLAEESVTSYGRHLICMLRMLKDSAVYV